MLLVAGLSATEVDASAYPCPAGLCVGLIEGLWLVFPCMPSR